MILNYFGRADRGLSFAVAGASLLHGTYQPRQHRDGFPRRADESATKLSQTTTGAKSFFLKAVDPFFKAKNGGTELPIKITGPKDHPWFELDRGGDNKKAIWRRPRKADGSSVTDPESRAEMVSFRTSALPGGNSI